MAWISSANVTPSPPANITPSTVLTNGTFWAGAAAIVSLVGIIVLGWITWRAANPKRRQLWYSLSTVTPLETTGTGIQSGDPNPAWLTPDEVRILAAIGDSDRPRKSLYRYRYKGSHWVPFHLARVDIQLVSNGRLDIPRSAFDDNQPLQMDVGAPIVKLVSVLTSPNQAKPPLETDGSMLFVGPCLIGRHETIVINLLVEGVPLLGPLHPSPENVDIRQGRPPESSRAISITLGFLGLTLTAAATTLLLIAYNEATGATGGTGKWFLGIRPHQLWVVGATTAVIAIAYPLVWAVVAVLSARPVPLTAGDTPVAAPDRSINDVTAAAERLAEATAAFAAELGRIREETQARIEEIQTSAAEAIQQAKANADAAVTDAEGRTAAAEQRAQKAIEQARAEAATRVGAAEADRDQAREQAERYRQDAQRADQRGAAVDARTEDAQAREDATPN
jgi:hypothetical protein